MVVTKREAAPTLKAPSAKAARGSAKLKEDLVKSVEIETAKSKVNGEAETDEKRKDRCVARLQELFAEGYKAEVRQLLKTYGDGAKNFHGVAVEKFAEIDQAIKELNL